MRYFLYQIAGAMHTFLCEMAGQQNKFLYEIAGQQSVKRLPSADKIEPLPSPPRPYSYRGVQPPLLRPLLQSRTPTEGSKPFLSPSSDVILV
ncbi:hypothetical protein AVEN_136083-1 [Araneus ventricosus]|uniref:Uncharacterized protein n=1 Tax=Araneus ventricosus TaxID=182803 RepID=A0A4Y2BE07_ARAVE|nr:hypothetical protein AVEN_136083-1 [Araneus ventricosus]